MPLSFYCCRHTPDMPRVTRRTLLPMLFFAEPPPCRRHAFASADAAAAIIVFRCCRRFSRSDYAMPLPHYAAAAAPCRCLFSITLPLPPCLRHYFSPAPRHFRQPPRCRRFSRRRHAADAAITSCCFDAILPRFDDILPRFIFDAAYAPPLPRHAMPLPPPLMPPAMPPPRRRADDAADYAIFAMPAPRRAITPRHDYAFAADAAAAFACCRLLILLAA